MKIIKNDNRSYYELDYPKTGAAYIAWVCLIGISLMILPIVLFTVAAILIRVKDHHDSPFVILAFLVLSAAFFYLWYGVIFKKAAEHRILAPKHNDRYRLKITDAHHYIRIEPLTDHASITDLFHKGALYFVKGDDGFMDYCYNLFADKGLIQEGDELVIYEISGDSFLETFSYYDKIYFKYDRIYVLPYSALACDKESFIKLKADPKIFQRWINFFDYGDLVMGAYSVVDYGIVYRYKDYWKQGEDDGNDNTGRS